MPTKFKVLAIAAALSAGASSAAMAQYACAPGYAYINGVCQPVRAPGYGNPVTGTANMLTPPVTCNYGYTYYNGACVPAR